MKNIDRNTRSQEDSATLFKLPEFTLNMCSFAPEKRQKISETSHMFTANFKVYTDEIYRCMVSHKDGTKLEESSETERQDF